MEHSRFSLEVKRQDLPTDCHPEKQALKNDEQLSLNVNMLLKRSMGIHGNNPVVRF